MLVSIVAGGGCVGALPSAPTSMDAGGIATAGAGGQGGTPARGGGGGGPPDASVGPPDAIVAPPEGGLGDGPLRLVIFYTRWGTSYPEWWPNGADRTFSMSQMMQPLEPFKQNLIVLSGLTNANVYTNTDPALQGSDANDMGDAMLTLLTARPAMRGIQANGPSFDTVVGDCSGAAGPPLRLQVGQFGYDDNPGVSFDARGTAIRGERDPNAAAMRVLGHPVKAPDPSGDINSLYPGIASGHMDVVVEALATSKACVATLMWGDQVVPTFLGDTDIVHNLSHMTVPLATAVTAPIAAPDPTGQFQKLQTFYAQEFAALLTRMSSAPVGAGTLLDRSVVVWISESGQGEDHRGYYIPVIIAGGAHSGLDVGRVVDIVPHPVPINDLLTIVRTQGDLFAALGRLWGLPPTFGDARIVRQPLTEILLP